VNALYLVPVTSLVAAPAEEWIFRGKLFEWVWGKLPLTPAAFLTSVAFTLAHLGWSWPRFLVSLGLCAVYVKWRSWIVCAIVHYAWNIAVFLGMLLRHTS